MSGAVRVLPLIALLAMAGCSTASNNMEVVSERAPRDASLSGHVNVNSRLLKSRIGFGEAITRQEGMLQHAQVTLENRTGSNLSFEYRWEWTDKDGFQLGDTLSSWKPAVINGKERKLMSSTGPGPGAVNFRLYVREPGS